MRDCDLAAAATLADLAGVHAVRAGLREELRPIAETDLKQLRNAARVFEIRMPPSQSLLKPVLEAQPDLVAIGGDSWERPVGASPLDPHTRDAAVGPIVRGLADSGIPTVLLVAPDFRAVKAAHVLGLAGVEFYTGSLVDLPATERAQALEDLADAAKLARKLKLQIGLAGRLGPHTAAEVVAAVPGVERVVVGRALIARAALVGIDVAVRDFRALVE